jgi:hypothetical protein
MPNPTTRDQLYELGGALMNGVGDFAGDDLYAYAYLNLPHNSPNGSMDKPNPFPSELIGQPIVVTLEFKNLQSIFSANNGDVSDAPTAFESAYFQVKQVHADDRGELMSMNGGRGSAYSFPLKAFYQNQVDIKCVGQTNQQLQLTGFRNGSVRSIIVWITKDSDTNPSPASGAALVKNFDNYILPREVELLYNGTVYYRAKDFASQIWNLVSTETPSQLECTVLSATGTAPNQTIVSTSKKANWLEIPFSQVYEQLSGAHMYVSGKMIANAVVNLNITLPDTAAYTVHAFYSYNAALMIDGSKGCEYVF